MTVCFGPIEASIDKPVFGKINEPDTGHVTNIFDDRFNLSLTKLQQSKTCIQIFPVGLNGLVEGVVMKSVLVTGEAVKLASSLLYWYEIRHISAGIGAADRSLQWVIFCFARKELHTGYRVIKVPGPLTTRSFDVIFGPFVPGTTE